VSKTIFFIHFSRGPRRTRISPPRTEDSARLLSWRQNGRERERERGGGGEREREREREREKRERRVACAPWTLFAKELSLKAVFHSVEKLPTIVFPRKPDSARKYLGNMPAAINRKPASSSSASQVIVVVVV